MKEIQLNVKKMDKQRRIPMKNTYDNERFFEAYSQMARSKGGLTSSGEWHQLQPLMPDFNGSIVLDLGCGYGWHSKYAVDCGAKHVLGIDISEKMIGEAQKRNADSKITYKVMGLTDYSYPENTYDCVLSNLVLHYIENLDEIYEKVWKTLKLGGVFLFNIEHPVFTSGVQEDWIYAEDGKPQCWPIDNYFYPGERVTNFLGQTVLKQHHTLTQILMGLLHAGFEIKAVEEAQPPKEMLNIAGMKDEMRRPMMLLVKAVKS